jgi:hypothetical protein
MLTETQAWTKLAELYDRAAQGDPSVWGTPPEGVLGGLCLDISKIEVHWATRKRMRTRLELFRPKPSTMYWWLATYEGDGARAIACGLLAEMARRRESLAGLELPPFLRVNPAAA